jgi:hypothetical protein
MPLDDPVPEKSIPTVGADSAAASGDRFRMPPLSHTALASLRRSMAHSEDRRRVYRGGQLRVRIDGEERWQFDSGGGVCRLFRVPIGASYVELFGDDDEGALLLAVFPLPGPAELTDNGPQYLGVTLEGGQTVTIEIALGDGVSGEGSALVIQLAYLNPTVVS